VVIPIMRCECVPGTVVFDRFSWVRHLVAIGGAIGLKNRGAITVNIFKMTSSHIVHKCGQSAKRFLRAFLEAEGWDASCVGWAGLGARLLCCRALPCDLAVPGEAMGNYCLGCCGRKVLAGGSSGGEARHGDGGEVLGPGGISESPKAQTRHPPPDHPV
jgi:hypothetical protein